MDNPNRDTAETTEDFAYTPDGGRGKMVTLGIALPIIIIIYAVHIWTKGEAYWPERGGPGIIVKGDTAKTMSVGYIFLSSFCHFRWFWGLFPHYLAFRVGTTISLIGILCAIVTGLYFLAQ